MVRLERLRNVILHQYARNNLRRPAEEVFAQLAGLSGKALLESQAVRNVVAYANNWEPLIVKDNPKVSARRRTVLPNPKTKAYALPYDFVTAANREASTEDVWGAQQFYWDTYFINRALLLTGKPEYRRLAKGQIGNLQYLFQRFGKILNGSSIDLSGTSQLPLLTSMIFDIYDDEHDRRWLKKKIAFAKREYKFWMLTKNDAKAAGIRGQTHRIDNTTLGIRYVGGDIEKNPYHPSQESGRDDTEAWARRGYSFQPIDLHCALYKYELDFAKAARVAGNHEEARHWENEAEKRKDYVNKKLWDENKGWFFNYDIQRDKKDTAYWDLHAFMALWVGLASPEQAAKMVTNLPKFEATFGLRMSPAESLLTQRERRRILRPVQKGSERMRRFGPTIADMTEPQQWDGDHMWSMSMIFAWEGLEKAGYREAAKRIAEKSLRSFSGYYSEKGTLSEKRNAVSGLNGKNHHYVEGAGFGVTMAETLIEYNYLQSLENKVSMLQSRHEPPLQA